MFLGELRKRLIERINILAVKIPYSYFVVISGNI